MKNRTLCVKILKIMFRRGKRVLKDRVKREILGVFLVGIATYIIYVLIKKGENPMDIGVLGTGIYTVLFKLFGIIAYVVPAILIVYGILFMSKLKLKFDKWKFISFIFLIILLSSLIITFDVETTAKSGDLIVKEIFRMGWGERSGGMIGALLSVGFFTILGKSGSIIILSTLLILNLLLLTNRSAKGVLLRIIIFVKKGLIKREGNKKREKYKVEIKKRIKKVAKKEIAIEENEKTADNFDDVVENEEKSNFVEFNIDREEFEKENKKNSKEIKTVEKEKKENSKQVEIEVEEKKAKKKEEIESKKESSKEEINIEDIFEERKIETNVKEIEANIKEKILRLENVLDEYGVDGKIINYERGPVITRFELSVARGTRVKKIVALTDDIAMNLEAKSIRIEAPIPGKNAIGIEIPNDIAEAVYFSTIYKLINKKYKSPLSVVLGKNIVGENIVIDLGKMPHLLIAGRTGSGKSVCINTLISSIISNAGSDEVRFIMIDPKMVELMPYNGIPHLLVPVIIEPKLAAVALKWAVNEMEDRYKKLAKTGVRNLESYNKIRGVEKLPYIVIVIDELADLMMVAPATIEESIARIAQKARAIGIHLVVATQRPSTDVITGTIKANLPSRISFSLASQIDSRIILDTTGAEKLLGKGDMLFLESGTSNLVRIQGAFISDEEVNSLTEILKKNGVLDYKDDILVEEICDKDELFEKAVAIIKRENKASASLMQRKLKVGYARAARIIDELVDYGIINENKEILIETDID